MIFQHLLQELIRHILSFVSFQDLLKFNKVCKRFHLISQDVIKYKVEELEKKIPEIMRLRKRKAYKDPFLPLLSYEEQVSLIIFNMIPIPHPIMLIKEIIRLFYKHEYDKILLFTSYFPNYLNSLSHYHFDDCWPEEVIKTEYFNNFFNYWGMSPFMLLLYFFTPAKTSLPPNSYYNIIPESQIKYRNKLIELFVDGVKLSTKKCLELSVKVGDVKSVEEIINKSLINEQLIPDYDYLITTCYIKKFIHNKITHLQTKNVNIVAKVIEEQGHFTPLTFYRYLLDDEASCVNFLDIALSNHYYESIACINLYNFKYYKIDDSIYEQLIDILTCAYNRYNIVLSDDSEFSDDENNYSSDSSVDLERDYYIDYEAYNY